MTSEDRYKAELYDPQENKGGQHCGTVSTGVKITDLLTGNIAICITEHSQHKNKRKALEALEWMGL